MKIFLQVVTVVPLLYQALIATTTIKAFQVHSTKAKRIVSCCHVAVQSVKVILFQVVQSQVVEAKHDLSFQFQEMNVVTATQFQAIS